MRCLSERIIEAAAARLLENGLSGDLREILRRPDAVPPDLVPWLAHAARCTRCGELLVLFIEAESGLRRVAVLPLFRHRAARSGLDDRAATDAGVYALAADSTAEKEETRILGESWTLTLSTEDGRYLVRILPREPEPGAIATLMRQPDSEPSACSTGAGTAAAAGSPAPTPSEPGTRLRGHFLRIGDREFAFDRDGVLYLPEFPAEGIALVVRE